MIVGDLYVAGTGLYLPPLQPLDEIVEAGLYTAEQLAVTQLASIAVSKDVYPADMAVAAAMDAIADSGHDRGDIAIALHAYLASQGLGGWHAASYVHRFAVGNDCPTIEVGQMSNGGMAALSLAITFLTAWRDSRAALVTTADRFEEIPHGRWSFDDGLIPGDGASACVISRDRGFARIASLCSRSDTTLEELHRGAAQFAGELSLAAASTSFRQRKQEYFETHSPLEAIRRFAAGSSAAVAGALRDASVDQDQIDHWILPNIGLNELQTYYLRRLGIALESTCWSFGRTVGHLGAGDQIAGVHHLRSTGVLKVGERCALVGIGAGFSWSCAVIEIVQL
jgi:3-oxoacyl-[acyl-carrier-protein] synthase-3